MIAAFVILVLVVIVFSKNEHCPLYKKRNLCNWAKFIAAMLVVNGHLFEFHFDNPLLARELNLGSECVSLFLFFSAYGLIHSYKQKGKVYLEGFISKRVVKIVLPLITAYIIAFPTYYFCVGEFSISEVIYTLYWGGPFLKFSWYVTEITVLYLLFYLVFNFTLSLQTKAFMLSVCTVLLMILLVVADQLLWYIKSLPAFIFGMYYCIYEKQVFDYVQRNKIMILPILLLLFLMTFRFDLVSANVDMLSKWRYTYASYYLVDLLFVFLVVFILSRLPENPESYGMFNCYYEIYLIQNIVMMVMGKCGLQSFMYIICCLMITPVMAYYVHKMNGRILKTKK